MNRSRAATRTAWPARRFERACGLTARDMVRIVRFYQARNAIKRGIDLVEVADMAGYADQAHMTREFRHFAGITPVPARKPAAYDVFYAQRSGNEM
ncbi:AraC family transcriptional regulator [Maricaulis sp.]|uniref:helix-turn-helix domain-containing protein n=1 Tax=Maricaulis sp. TaxID=1486257 RepID=UPI0025D58D85|nr:AraC family transcriptional regulator [Maricaulis sp.]MDF1767832.1 AraC family transcriptional regulator [Maricaulis sp.]